MDHSPVRMLTILRAFAICGKALQPLCGVLLRKPKGFATATMKYETDPEFSLIYTCCE